MSDFYDNTTSYDGMIRELEQARETIRQQSQTTMKKALIIIVSLFMVVAGILILTDAPFFVIAIIAGSLGFVYLLIFGIVTSGSQTELLYDHVYRNAVELYNYNHDDTFTFEYRPKLSRDFNISMGLFTRMAAISSKFQMTSSLESGATVTIQQCTMTTSNGKSSTTHFSGIYITLSKRGVPIQQVRSNGRPHLKGVKFDRLEEYEERAYVVEGSSDNRIHPNILSLYNEIPNTFDVRSHYIASNNEEVHIALWLRTRPKVPKTVTYQSLEGLVNELHDVMNYSIDVMHQLEEMI